MSALDEIILNVKGSQFPLRGALFLNKSKGNTIEAVYLPKQNIYLIIIRPNYLKDPKHEIYYYKLVPINNEGKRFCKLLKIKKGICHLATCGFEVYDITSEECSYLIEKEKFDTNVIKKEVEKHRSTTFTVEEMNNIILQQILNSQGLQVSVSENKLQR